MVYSEPGKELKITVIYTVVVFLKNKKITLDIASGVLYMLSTP